LELVLTRLEHSFGIEYSHGDTTCVFGNKNLEWRHLSQKWPLINFVKVKQVHGIEILDCDNDTFSAETCADGLTTLKKNLGLVIQTADCIPLLGSCSSTGRIFALHAGWRGVEAKIHEKFFSKFSASDIWNVFAGPHIGPESFEVAEDVALKLLKTHPDAQTVLKKKVQAKSWIDLESLVKLHLNDITETKITFNSCHVDTVQNLQWHSFRRDRERAGRQLSFIFRN
jgi:polyphenol oxidase